MLVATLFCSASGGLDGGNCDWRESTHFALGVSPSPFATHGCHLRRGRRLFRIESDTDASARHFRFRADINSSVSKTKVFSIFFTQNETALFSLLLAAYVQFLPITSSRKAAGGGRKPFYHLIKPLALPMKLLWQMRSLLHFS